MRDVGITAALRIAPVMAHQFHVDFETEQSAKAAEAQLGALRDAATRPALELVRDGSRIFAGCQIYEEVRPDAVLAIAGSDRSIPFFQLFYQVDGLKSGMHHPDGMLWIRSPKRDHSVDPIKVPLISVAPTLLEMLGLPKPAYMRGESIRSALRE